MPEGVIDCLEVIDVDQSNRQGGMSTNRTRNLCCRLALPGTRVEQAGLGVDPGSVDELDMPERALEQRHEREGEEDRQRRDRDPKGDQDGYTGFGDVVLDAVTCQIKLAQGH